MLDFKLYHHLYQFFQWYHLLRRFYLLLQQGVNLVEGLEEGVVAVVVVEEGVHANQPLCLLQTLHIRTMRRRKKRKTWMQR